MARQLTKKDFDLQGVDENETCEQMKEAEVSCDIVKADSIVKLYRNPMRWIRNHWFSQRYSPKGHTEIPCFCLDGAAQAIYLKKNTKKNRARYVQVLVKLANAIRELDPTGFDLCFKPDVEGNNRGGYLKDGIIAWNDKEHRTIHEVVKVARRAGV